MTLYGDYDFLKDLKFGSWFAALLSAPMSSELPFCEDTLLGKQLISPILFCLSKNGKKGVVHHGLGSPNVYELQRNRNLASRQVLKFQRAPKRFLYMFPLLPFEGLPNLTENYKFFLAS